MRSGVCNYQSVRVLRAYFWAVVFACVVLSFFGCSGNGHNSGNKNQADGAVATNNGAGQSNGASGAQVNSAAGVAGALQAGTGETKVTTTTSASGTGATKSTAGAGGKATTAGNGGSGGSKASGAGGTTAGNGGNSGTEDSEGDDDLTGGTEPTVACTNPAEKSAPIPVKWTSMGEPNSGPYEVILEEDPTIPNTTPAHPDLTNLDIKLPIIAWVNGGCMDCSLLFIEFLADLASYGFLVIVDGTPIDRENPCSPTNWTISLPQGQDGETQKRQITWAIAENERPCSQYYQKLDTTKVATMGTSCGGMSTWMSADDPRLTTMVVLNMGMGGSRAILDQQHVPVLNLVGGAGDIGKPGADADFAANATTYPLFYGVDPDMDHNGGYTLDNGGPWSPVIRAWLSWQLKGDEGATTGKGMFWGPDCGLCNTDWIIQKKNME